MEVPSKGTKEDPEIDSGAGYAEVGKGDEKKGSEVEATFGDIQERDFEGVEAAGSVELEGKISSKGVTEDLEIDSDGGHAEALEDDKKRGREVEASSGDIQEWGLDEREVAGSGEFEGIEESEDLTKFQVL